MNSRRPLLFFAGLACCCLLNPGNSFSDEPMTPGNPQTNQANADQQRNLSQEGMIFLSNKLGDFNVFFRDDTSTKLGKLDNLIINEHTGDVVFVILDTGLMGKKIAVPRSALQVRKGTKNDANQFWFSLNKTKDELKTAPTFDKHQMAQITDRNWQEAVGKFFGVRTVAKSKDLQGAGPLTVHDVIFESSKLGDLNVYNRRDINQKLGNLDNLVIDAQAGKVEYAILDTGMGGKTIAVPWDALLLQKERNQNKYSMTLNKTPDELKNAPTFDMKNLAVTTRPQWQQSVNTFFGIRTASRPETHQNE